VEKLLISRQIERALLLDSDAVLFSEANALFDLIPDGAHFACSKAGGPALTFLRKTIEPFLDLIIRSFRDPSFLSEQALRKQNAEASGGMGNLTDMQMCEIFSINHPQGFQYPNHTSIGHLDHCINNPDGMSFRQTRRRQRKRVFWKAENELCMPFFQDASTQKFERALLIHFQSSAKRLIQNFNPISGTGKKIQALRLWYYNFLMA